MQVVTNLFSSNHPKVFWQLQTEVPDELWNEAINESLPYLMLGPENIDLDSILAMTLGEGRFGSNHWDLGVIKRIYYQLKPIIPKPIIRQIRRFLARNNGSYPFWPVDTRYVEFLWQVMHKILIKTSQQAMKMKCFWPQGKRFSLVLTHDIETAAGQEFVNNIAELEESFGFRSLFNFVPERYKVDRKLMGNMIDRGFEIGVHGLKHDGLLFESKKSFLKKAITINQYLKSWSASGFRAELTIRHPEWMQALEMEYDLSFFDTDPFEPIPGGTMSIWPFMIGHFLELPYTLVQDNTLITILREESPNNWLQKIKFLEKYHGMALVNTHPDYLMDSSNRNVYKDFLAEIYNRNNYWHALPNEIAAWWKTRIGTHQSDLSTRVYDCQVELDGTSIRIA